MNVRTLSDIPPWEWPENARKVITDALANHRAKEEDRVIGAELAGDLIVMNEDLAGLLLKIVEDSSEPEELRARGAISFGPILEQSDIERIGEDEEISISDEMFERIQETLKRLVEDEHVSKEVRRRAMEASVRASQDWHQSAVRTAYDTGDSEWVLTAVFAMRWVRGFEDEVLKSLKSTDPEIHLEAVNAAGSKELDAAWPHVRDLVENGRTPKPLLLAAIEAAGCIRPSEAVPLLTDLADSRDEEIADAAEEAIMMATARTEAGEFDDEEEEEEEEE
jgi:hypothetical protein